MPRMVNLTLLPGTILSGLTEIVAAKAEELNKPNTPKKKQPKGIGFGVLHSVTFSFLLGRSQAEAPSKNTSISIVFLLELNNYKINKKLAVRRILYLTG